MDFKLGKLYEIKFYDHGMGGGLDDKPILCSVCGWVKREDDIQVVLTTWFCEDDDVETHEANTEPCSIIKAVIVDAWEIS